MQRVDGTQKPEKAALDQGVGVEVMEGVDVRVGGF